MNKHHALSKEKGWWDGVKYPSSTIPEKLCLVHSEISEALECYRDGQMALEYTVDKQGNQKPVGFPSELADAMIRLYDLAGALGIDLDAAVEIKYQYNRTRPFRHGGKAC